ncbi:hypothetical protein [Conexibacter sp. SYSU D00693]|uniref:hypothetical protein n=1 Tax=Conexibacter sp. SYSU D00693 TaxID=2812560 RepID=UPI00196A91BF|nr:hypothetical protein [Conexibacter sp. SYSU D00693]
MNPNVLQWDGAPGHYEVHYLSATDPATGIGLWIRYTMRAPVDGPAECHLWFMAMAPDGSTKLARKGTFPIERLVAEAEPFRLEVAGSVLTDQGMQGGFEDVAWDLSWTPSLAPYEHVHPVLRRARIAKTVLVLPHADLAVSGTVTFAGTELRLDGVPGGQAHLWGSKHAGRWTWLHCNDLDDADSGERAAQTFVDGVSVVVPRFGRDVGPSSPLVGRFLGEDFRAVSPRAVLGTASAFDLTSWRFEARDGKRKLVGEASAPRASLVGVTYQDPDGDEVWCYNSEVATLRLQVLDKQARGRGGWAVRQTLVGDGTAHFEYAQRTPVDGLELLVT